MKYNITAAGKAAILNSLSGGSTINFCKIRFGNGQDAGEDATELSNPIVDIGINEIIREGEFVSLVGVLNNADVENRFKANEIGVYITDPDDENNEILFAYAYGSDEEATTIPAATDYTFETVEKAIIYVGNVADVTAVLVDSSYYATKEMLKEHQDKNDNPHKVTAEQVGALPITGGTLQGPLAFGSENSTIYESYGDFCFKTDNNRTGYKHAETVLSLKAEDYTVRNLLRIYHTEEGVSLDAAIYGAHIVAEGSYTGTGEGDRTIEIGGDSNLLVITVKGDVNNGQYGLYELFIIAGSDGAIAIDKEGKVTVLHSGYMYFYRDTIQMTLHSDYLNKYGVTYNYRTLIIE